MTTRRQQRQIVRDLLAFYDGVSSVRPLIQSHTTSLSPNWREMDLKGGLFTAQGIGWIATSWELRSMAQCPDGDQ